jgi:spore coat-associated protein N
VGVSALAGTISAPFDSHSAGLGAARWIRSALSLLVAVGILAVALPVAFDSGARGAGVDPVQVFSSSPAIAVDSSGGAQLSVAGLVPGQSRVATIRVSNAGSGASQFSLSAHTADRVGPGGTPLSSALNLRIAPSGGSAPALYDGPLSGLGRLDLGQIAAGAARAYGFTVTLPRSAGNGVEGSSLSAGFTWNAS